MESTEASEKPSQQKSLTWVTIVFAITLLFIAFLGYYLVFLYPDNQVSQLGITNATEKADLINQYRTTSIQLISTLAQILGGSAVLVGIYFAWKNFQLAQATLESNQKNAEKSLEVTVANIKSDQETAQKNIEIALATLDSNIKNAQKSLEVTQEGQITERFTRAVDQLGNEKIEIRLGGIYALERIANESEKDYWPIIEIFTAYVRENSACDENSNLKVKHNKIQNETPLDTTNRGSSLDTANGISLDIQATLTVIKRRRFFFNAGEPYGLDLRNAYLYKADLLEAHLEGANLINTNLSHADLRKTHLERINIQSTPPIKITKTRLEGAYLEEACLEEANLPLANLKGAHLVGANLKRANLSLAILDEANLRGADLRGAKITTINSISKVKTLYDAKLDPELEDELREKGFGHLLDDEPK